jgi:parallel beta-helix repeat protein
MKHVILSTVLGFGFFLSGCGSPTSIDQGTTNTAEPTEPSDTLEAEAAAGNGLNAEYFNNQDFSDPGIKRLESNINFNWGTGSPASSIDFNTFSARYSGELSAPSDGEYTFYATADDGVRLSLDGKAVLEDFSDHASRTSSGTVTLKANQRLPLKLEYYENTGRASLRLEWSGPGVSRRVIPKSRLFSSEAAPAPTPNGSVFYVAPNGKNENPGSEALPWLTINKAAQTLTPGQTVLVKNGTYAESIYINRSGAPGKPITFKAFPGAAPKIEVRTKDVGGITIQGASYINLDGFFLEYTAPGAAQANGEQIDDGIALNDGPGAVLTHHVNITNNKVRGFPGGGIGTVLTDYIRIEGNTVWENAFYSKYNNSGISLYQSVDFDAGKGFHNVIRGNTVFKNENRVPGTGIGNTTITDGNCIIIDDSRHTQSFLPNKTKYPAAKGGTLVENNICADNGARGVHVYSSDNVLARHNTLFQNQRTSTINDGELSAYDADNVQFVNNIVYARTGKKATGTGNATNIVFERNLYFGTTDIANKSSSDIVADPLFENASTDLNSANFRLKAGSPAIDAALAGQSPATDVGGKPRPQGKAADIGAWESR